MTERFYELAGIRFRILGPKDCLRDSGQFLKNYDAQPGPWDVECTVCTVDALSAPEGEQCYHSPSIQIFRLDPIPGPGHSVHRPIGHRKIHPGCPLGKVPGCGADQRRPGSGLSGSRRSPCAGHPLLRQLLCKQKSNHAPGSGGLSESGPGKPHHPVKRRAGLPAAVGGMQSGSVESGRHRSGHPGGGGHRQHGSCVSSGLYAG